MIGNRWLVCDGNTRLTEMELKLFVAIASKKIPADYDDSGLSVPYPDHFCEMAGTALCNIYIPCIVLGEATPPEVVLAIGSSESCCVVVLHTYIHTLWNISTNTKGFIVQVLILLQYVEGIHTST